MATSCEPVGPETAANKAAVAEVPRDASRPLRVAMILPGLHHVNRGAEVAFEAIAAELCRIAGFEVTLFGMGEPRPECEYRFVHVAAISRERFRRIPAFPVMRNDTVWEELCFATQLYRTYRPEAFDAVLSCSYPFINWLISATAKRSSSPARHVFVTQNGDWPVRSDQSEFKYFHCDHLVCTNPDYYDANRARWPSHLIPNGVDPARFSPGPAAKAKFGVPEDAPLVLMVSALIPSKRVLEGIRAVAKVDDVRLIVAGSGPMHSQVRGLGKQLLGERFQLLEVPRGEMLSLYRSANVLLHMSIDEPSANAYTEAMAVGVPVITHDRRVTRWTFGELANLVDTTHEDEVVTALQNSLGAKTDGFAAASHRRAAELFSWRSIARQYADVLGELVAAQPAGTRGLATCNAVDRATLGAVVIGRNEGSRLRYCLESVRSQTSHIVYVDSGSTDESLAVAQSLAVETVALDVAVGFTAARARNAGVRRLFEVSPEVEFVQFVDGDCELAAGWVDGAAQFLAERLDVAVACGRRRERDPQRNVYHRLVDMEWDTPAGETKSCGGDALVRLSAFSEVGGFREESIAGEEPELCVRLRRAGWKVWRLDRDMTWHDIRMSSFQSWWKRTVRGGYAYAEGFALHGGPPERHCAKELRSILFWGALLPAVGVGLAWPSRGISLLILAVMYLALFAKILRYRTSVRRDALPEAGVYALSCIVGKWAQAAGVLAYVKCRLLRSNASLIEYRAPNTAGEIGNNTPRAPIESHDCRK